MSGLDREERELFAKGVWDAAARATGPELDAALADLGWGDALGQDPRTAVSVLFEAQGRTLATSGALDWLLAAALGAEAGPAVVLPPLGSIAPPGWVEQGTSIDGLLTAAGGTADTALVVCATDDGPALGEVALHDLARRTVGGLDPSLGLLAASGSASVTARPAPPRSWDDVVAAGQRALASELVGASAAMLDLAREHALERIQFGVPIASFQAVRHKLAETYVSVESARAALDAAWADPSAFNASVAKAVAGRSARLAAKHCQQVLAGIGFTTEHPLHRYIKRVRVLDGLLGDTRSLTRSIGAQLLDAGGLPAILPL
jgi:hypothetical protein